MKGTEDVGLSKKDRERLIQKMREVIGDNADKINSWLTTPNKSLKDRKPIDVLKEKEGMDKVWTLLIKKEWGTLD